MRFGKYCGTTEKVMVWEWILILLVTFIPILNIITFIILLFSRRTKYSVKTFIIALFIFLLILVLFYFSLSIFAKELLFQIC